MLIRDLNLKAMRQEKSKLGKEKKYTGPYFSPKKEGRQGGWIYS